MTPPPNNLDIVAAATAIFSWMVNPQLAVYIVPYFVIIVSAIAGAYLQISAYSWRTHISVVAPTA